MIVYRLINSPVDSNCFVLAGNVDGNCIIVDPGTEDCKSLFEFLDKQKLNVQYVFITHEHIDHIIGLKTLKEKYDCKIVCSSACAGHLNNTRYNLSRMAEQFTPCDSFPEADITFNENISVLWQGTEVRFSKMLGHSEGSAVMFVDNQLFVGDNLIKAYKTTTTLPGGSKIELVDSLRKILIEYSNPEMMVHFGHFESCYMRELKPEIERQICFLEEKLKGKIKWAD